MNIQNTPAFSFEKSGERMMGRLKMTRKEFDAVVRSFVTSRAVPLFERNALRDAIRDKAVARIGCVDYWLGRGFARRCADMLGNGSRYHFRDHNYIIQVNNTTHEGNTA